MRFAPPKSAPPGPRKCTKDTEEEKVCHALTGWAIKPEQHDVSLLAECLTDIPRRCSSATDRYSSSEPLIINFRRCAANKQTNTHTYLNKHTNLNSKGGVGKRTHSRDSGVDVLTDSGIDNMDSIDSTVASSIDSAADMRAREDEEFSDISESNDGSLANEVNENDLLDNVELDNEIMAAEDEELGHESLSPESSRTLLEDAPPPPPQNDTPNEYKLVVAPGMEPLLLTSHLSRTSLDKNAFQPRNKRKVKKAVLREHQIPHSVTPDKPEVASPVKQQPWSRTRKLERSSTTPSVCSYTDMVYDSNVKKETSPEQYLANPFEYLLHANRPQGRPEKRRSSLGLRSSCSIPSFSTPSQALLLIGMTPTSNKPRDATPSYTTSRRGSPHKPPLIRRSRDLDRPTAFELPALSVNGAGDLVIRKKHIITG